MVQVPGDRGSVGDGQRYEPLITYTKLPMGGIAENHTVTPKEATTIASANTALKETSFTPKESITAKHIFTKLVSATGSTFTKLAGVGVAIKLVFARVVAAIKRETPAKTDEVKEKIDLERAESEPEANAGLRVVERLRAVDEKALPEEMRMLCEIFKSENLTGEDRVKILSFLRDNPSILQNANIVELDNAETLELGQEESKPTSAAENLLNEILGRPVGLPKDKSAIVELMNQEIRNLARSMPNPDKALTKEQLIEKTKQLLTSEGNPSATLEKALGPKAAGLAALLAEITNKSDEANFKKLRERIEGALLGAATPEVQDLRDAYVLLLSRALGSEIAGKYIAFEFKNDVDKLVQPGKGMNIDSRFREDTIAGTLYRGFVRAELTELQPNSRLMQECIEIAKSRNDVKTRSRAVFNKVNTAFREKMSPQLRELNKTLYETFEYMFKEAKESGVPRYAKYNPSEEAEKQLVNITFLRLITPVINKARAAINDREESDRVKDTVTPLQSAATYSKSGGARQDAIAAGLVDEFEEFGNFLRGG